MTAAAFQSRDEALAGGLAFAMHVLFLVLLVFGVSWQHKPAETAAVVDLWRDLPSVMPPKVEVEPPAAEAPPVVAAAAVAAAFEVPTLDIPFPPSIPKMRDTPSPAARSSEPAGPPASEQITIPALELGQLSKESPDEGSNPVAHVEGFGDIALAHHGIAPGQPIASYTGEDLATVVRWVNRDTPRPDAAAIVTAVMVELGFKRKGKKITDAITSAAVATGALTDEPVAIVAGPDAIAS